MAVPSETDIKKRREKLKSFLKHLDEEGRCSEKHILQMARSAIRRVWMKSPTKLALLYENTIPDMNPNTRTKWLCRCEMCDKLHKLADIQIDHRVGEHSLKSFDEILEFITSILDVKWDDLALLCKPCHEVKTLAERNGCTLEEAKVLKQVIAIEKKKLAGVKAFLAKHGVEAGKNAGIRHNQLIQVISEMEVEYGSQT